MSFYEIFIAIFCERMVTMIAFGGLMNHQSDISHIELIEQLMISLCVPSSVSFVDDDIKLHAGVTSSSMVNFTVPSEYHCATTCIQQRLIRSYRLCVTNESLSWYINHYHDRSLCVQCRYCVCIPSSRCELKPHNVLLLHTIERNFQFIIIFTFCVLCLGRSTHDVCIK